MRRDRGAVTHGTGGRAGQSHTGVTTGRSRNAPRFLLSTSSPVLAFFQKTQADVLLPAELARAPREGPRSPLPHDGRLLSAGA